MATKNERLDISMRILGAREMEREGERAAKGVKKPGEAARYTEKSTTKLGKANSFLTRSYGALGRAARYGIGILGVTGVFALQQAVTNTEELSKTTTGLNRNLGLSVKVGSEWAAVAHARGIATTALNMGFTKMARSFVEANRKGGTARTALNQLGIGISETEKGAHNFNYALELVAKQFGKAHAGPQRQAAAMALLGKGYSTVLPLFAEGNKGLQEQLHWAEKYGVTLDGKTNSALMGMVNAQRESKVAMLGLQVSLTKALMPAIEGGQEQLQKFIAVLNSDELSPEQKINHIQKMFENLEDFLIKFLADALPKVAESGGLLGVKLAEAIWIGFEHSNLVGKLVISAWLFKFMGGGGLIKMVAGTAGKAIAMGIIGRLAPTLMAELAAGSTLGQALKARWFALGETSSAAYVAGWIGIFVSAFIIGFLGAEQLDRMTHGAFRQWGVNAGQNFINALISVVNTGIEGINRVLDEGNALSVFGVDAPNLGTIGPVNFHGGAEGGGRKHHHLPGLQTPPGVELFPGGKKGGKRPQQPKRRNLSDLFGDQHIHLEVDGKEMAHVVLRHGERAAARA